MRRLNLEHQGPSTGIKGKFKMHLSEMWSWNDVNPDFSFDFSRRHWSDGSR